MNRRRRARRGTAGRARSAPGAPHPLRAARRAFEFGQTVVVTYTDPNPGSDDTDGVIQDEAGNDAASFTTGENGVPAFLNEVPRPNAPATGLPVVTGTARVGETVTASTAGIRDANGLTNVSYVYQWIRDDSGTETDISGATSSTYELVAADAGKRVKVKVSFVDDDGYDEELTSAAFPRSGTISTSTPS